MNPCRTFSVLRFLHRLNLKQCVDKCFSQHVIKRNYSHDPEDGHFSDGQNNKTPRRVDPKSLKAFVGDMYTGHLETSADTAFPSDEANLSNITQNRKSYLTKPERDGTDPSLTSVLMFPGQGNHFVGMGKNLIHIPGAKDVYDRASVVLEYDLLEICLKGPESKLSKTEFSQPAIVVTSLAAVEKLREERPQAVDMCVAAAGFSVGEITALIFAESLSFEDGIKLIKLRAEAMQRCSEEVSSGMMTVVYDSNSYVKEAMLAAREYCKVKVGIEDPVCKVAAYVGTERKVIAGHTEALDFLLETQKDFGIRNIKRLNVSGAFHTNLMKEASLEVKQALAAISFSPSIVPVYSNVTGKPFSSNSNRAKNSICDQIVEPVKWEQTVKKIYSRPQGTAYPNTYEVGPRRSLGHLLKATDRKALRSYKFVEV
ncbi:probable malonyl-CoA-acyl carrier protein transacylase, mitochondrial [Argopecten irradians]|uniref:probable malonyl-CoA-acyl carrier protein transacylase, mitochondrial n=1 Tax=Argopecten irradians TaxID=31199 RepID=UPI0037235BD4